MTRVEHIADRLWPHCKSRLDAAVLAADLEATPANKRWTLWGVVFGRTQMKAAAVNAWLTKHGYQREIER